jgi:hypothetical protein
MVILYETCKRQSADSGHTKSDTITYVHYVYYKDTTRTKPTLVQRIRDTLFESYVEYYPAEGYSELLEQFQTLKQDLLSRNIYKDSIYLDSLGWVKIIDTVQKNTLTGREIVKNIRIPEKTTFVINDVVVNKREFYGGPSLRLLSPTTFGVGGGILYKDLKNRMYGGNVFWDGGRFTYGVSYYTLLKKNK